MWDPERNMVPEWPKVDGGKDSYSSALVRASHRCVCFFFQAEDGIRDVAVTGVQTCALPISSGSGGTPKAALHRHGDMLAATRNYAHGVLELRPDDVTLSTSKLFFAYGLGNEIGRASCRERG